MSGKYDITLKELFVKPPTCFLKLLTGYENVRFLDVQLPETTYRQADLVVELPDKSIFHLEIQSSNDRKMLKRMYGYNYFIFFKYDKLPKQMVLYIGNDDMKMKNKMKSEDVKFRYHLLDVRDIASDELLNSESIDDNIIALLCNQDKEIEILRVILDKIRELKSETQVKNYLKKIAEISYLRKFDTIFLEEVNKMPIRIDVKDHKLFQQGREEGIQKGREEGKISSITHLHTKLGFSAEKIADVLEIEIEYVKEILSEEI